MTPHTLYSWLFSYYSALIHWLTHGNMTSNNETSFRQMPWAGRLISWKQCENYDVKRKTVYRFACEILTAAARDPSLQLKVTWCCRWNLSAFFKICFCFLFFVLLYNKPLNDWSRVFQWNIEILGKQNSLFPRGPVISVQHISLLSSAYLQYSWNHWWSFVSCVYPPNVCAKDKLKGTITCLLEDITY